MHYIFVSTVDSVPWGGSEELWSLAALRLCEQGHRVGVCVADWQPPHPRLQKLAAAGGFVHFRRSPRSLWRRVRSRLARTGQPDFPTVQARNWIKQSGPGLVCISQGGNGDGLKWMKWCAENGLPYAIITQSNSEFAWFGDEWAAELRQGYESAKAVFFVSEANRLMLEDQISARLTNASVVKNPYNVPFDCQIAWPGQPEPLSLACVARLEPPAKGHDLLLRVLAQEKWKGRNLNVHLYGKGIGENTIRRLIALHKLTNVFLEGHVDSVVDIWKKCHALVLPSRYEGLPLALVEAMLCRRPAIVTTAGGNAELCQDEITGFVAAAPTVQLLDESLERAWNNRGRLQKMGEQARLHAIQCIPRDPVADFCQALTNAIKIA